MDFITECLLLVLIIFSPMIYGGITALPLAIIQSLSFLLFFLVLSRRLLSPKLPPFKAPILFILLFLSVPILQLYAFFPALTIDSEATISMLLLFLSGLFVFLSVLNYTDTVKKLKRLILAILFSGFIYSFYGFMIGISINKSSFSVFTNRNHFAGYIEMIIPLGIGYALAEPAKLKKMIFVFLTSIMALALFFSFSRAGIICFALSMFSLLFLLKIKRPLKRGLNLLLVLSAFLILFLGFIGSASVALRLKTLSSPFAAYLDRFNLLKDSFNIIRDFPLFGTGLGTFGDIIQKYNTSLKQVSWVFAHNEPLNLLVETGIVGFFLVCIFLIFYFKSVFSAWVKRNSAFAVYLTLGAAVGIIAVSLHSWFDFLLHIPANLILFFIVLGIAYVSAFIKEPQNPLPLPEFKPALNRSLQIILIVVIALATIFAQSLIWRRYTAEAIFEQYKDLKITEQQEEGIIKYRKALKEIDRAIALNPINSRYYARKADLLTEIYLRDDFNGLLGSFEDLKDAGKLRMESISLYSEAIRLNPYRADYHLRLGWAYGFGKELKLMDDEFQKALLLDPQNSQLRSYISQYRSQITALAGIGQVSGE